MWARGYFAASSGNVSDDVIREDITNQDINENMKFDNFELGQF